MTPQSSPPGLLTRRGLLSGTAGIGVAATLAACGSGADPGTRNGGQSVDGYQPPTHVPYEGVTPEFPAEPDGVPAGFTKLPDELGSMGNVPLPAIEPVSALIQGSPPAAGLKTAYYEALTADTGCDFKVTFGGYGTYEEKFQVTVASGDLPDVVMITNVRQLPQLLESKFTDLTEFIGGDKVLEYPGLASISPACWQVPVLNGRLWGVSKSRPAAEGKVLQLRGDVLSEHGVDPRVEVTDGEEFMALLGELTNPGTESFALSQDPLPWLMPVLAEMFGAPNVWREEAGSFVHQYETPEMAAAVEQAAKIWKAGYLHPLSFTDPQTLGLLEAGKIAGLVDGVAGWTGYVRKHGWDMHGLVAPKWDGGGPAVKHLTDAGYPGYAAIRKQDSPDRVREILRVMDYIASPFGTEEWLRVNFGVAGEHYTVANGVPEPTDRRTQEFFKIDYLGSQADAQLFVPGDRAMVKAQHDFLKTVMPTGEADAASGLYSDAASADGPSAERKVKDAISSIMQGRKTMSEWDAVVATWKKEAGDAMRSEYEEAAQQT